MKISDQIAARWNRRWDTAGNWKSAFENALIALQAPAYQRGEIAKDNKLSAMGVAVELRVKLASNVVPRLKRDTDAAQRALDAIRGERAALANLKVDPTDLAAAMRRQEARQLVRGMSLSEQAATLLNGDPLFVEAVLEMPSRFSGVPDDLRSKVENNYVETRFGPQLADLADREELLTTVRVAAEMARSAIVSEATLPDNDKGEAARWFEGIAA